MTHGAPVKKRQNGDVQDPEEDEYHGMVKPPDGGWGWMVVFASFAIHIVTDGMTYSFGIFYLEFLDYFNEGKGYTAWIASILVGVTLCSGPVSSAFVNRYGCRPVTIAGAFLGGICLILSCFAQNVFTLFITIGLGAGLGFGLIYLPAIVSVTMYFEKYRSLATGIAVCGSGFGTMVFAPITNTLIINYGWRGALLIIAGIVFNCAIFGAMFRPLEPEKKIALKEIANGDDAEHMQNRSHSERIYRQKKRSVGMYLSPTNEDELTPIQRSHSLGHGLLKPNQLTTTENNNPNGKLNASITGEAHRLAVSQPLLNSRFAGDRILRRTGSGIMYKKDVFYRGSVHGLHQHKSHSTDMGSTEGHRYGSVHQIASLKSQELAEVEEKAIACGCIPCSPETADTLNEMLHFGLLKDPVFIIFTVSNFLTSIGFNIPYVYIAPQAEVLKLTNEQGSYLLAIIGIANTVGRIILGYFSDKEYVNRLLVYNLCLTICGIGCALSVFCYNFYTMAMYACVFGCTIGAYVGLTSVILVDLLGLDKLTNAFGILLLFQGIASFAGPPIAGSMYDFTGKYEPGFLLAGASIGFSGLILFFIPPLQRYLAKKQRATSNHAQAINL